LERDEALVKQWLKKDYPKIKALAGRKKAEIYFGDAAHIRSDHYAGRTWAKKGETPVVLSTGSRHSMSMISAITSKGHMRFMIKERGGVNAEVFVEFMKRLLVGAPHKIFLIVDRGPTHIAKKTRAFVEMVVHCDYFICRRTPLKETRTSWCGSMSRPIQSVAQPLSAVEISRAR
jgi:hypothetical protein